MTSSRLNPRMLIVGAVILVGTTVAAFVWSRSPTPPPTPPSRPDQDTITSLGRISPNGEALRISARSISGQPSLVAELLVKEGDAVKRGSVLAVLNSREQLEANTHAADARLQVAERRLALVKAGAKETDVAAQRIVVLRLETELNHAEAELRRYRMLQAANAISAAEFDGRKVAADVATRHLEQAREQLRGLTDVRAQDVALAEAEVAAAATGSRVARAESAQSQIRSPIDGRVLEIHSRPGEELKPAGLLELAPTSVMYVVAEVSDSDIARVRPGQRATATSAALGTANGVVERIASKVAKKDVLDVDPTAMSDARVVEVWIRLDAAEKAAGLIHGEVTVRITP